MGTFRARAEGSKFFATPWPRVIAHRGSSGVRPENTLLSFEKAVADGADIIETDVHMSADGELVCIHDCTVARTTDGAGNAHDMPYAQLREFDAAFRFSKDGGTTYPFRGRGIYIPRLEEVLQAFPEVPLTIEVKDECPELIERLVLLLHRYGRIRDGSALVAAGRGKAVKTLRKLAPEVLTGYSRAETYRFLAGSFLHMPFLAGDSTGDVVLLSDKVSWWTTSARTVRLARQRGIEVHCYTVNDKTRMSKLLALGVDGIVTDYPAVLREVVDQWLSSQSTEAD